MIRSKEGDAQILVYPEWIRIVQQRDRDYIDFLLNDFKVRAGLDPAALLKQIPSLNVGPVVTCETGSSLKGHPLISGQYRSFVQF